MLGTAIADTTIGLLEFKMELLKRVREKAGSDVTVEIVPIQKNNRAEKDAIAFSDKENNLQLTQTCFVPGLSLLSVLPGTCRFIPLSFPPDFPLKQVSQFA